MFNSVSLFAFRIRNWLKLCLMYWLILITTLNTPCRSRRRCFHGPLSNCYAPKSPGFYGRTNKTIPPWPRLYLHLSSSCSAVPLFSPLSSRRPHCVRKRKPFSLLPVSNFLFAFLIVLCFVVFCNIYVLDFAKALFGCLISTVYICICMYVYICVCVQNYGQAYGIFGHIQTHTQIYIVVEKMIVVPLLCIGVLKSRVHLTFHIILEKGVKTNDRAREKS